MSRRRKFERQRKQSQKRLTIITILPKFLEFMFISVPEGGELLRIQTEMGILSYYLHLLNNLSTASIQKRNTFMTHPTNLFKSDLLQPVVFNPFLPDSFGPFLLLSGAVAIQALSVSIFSWSAFKRHGFERSYEKTGHRRVKVQLHRFGGRIEATKRGNCFPISLLSIGGDARAEMRLKHLGLPSACQEASTADSAAVPEFRNASVHRRRRKKLEGVHYLPREDSKKMNIRLYNNSRLHQKENQNRRRSTSECSPPVPPTVCLAVRPSCGGISQPNSPELGPKKLCSLFCTGVAFHIQTN